MAEFLFNFWREIKWPILILGMGYGLFVGLRVYELSNIEPVAYIEAPASNLVEFYVMGEKRVTHADFYSQVIKEYATSSSLLASPAVLP